MDIILEKKEVHFSNPSLEELADGLEYIRSKPEFDNFKVMIDGSDENTITTGKLPVSS